MSSMACANAVAVDGLRERGGECVVARLDLQDLLFPQPCPTHRAPAGAIADAFVGREAPKVTIGEVVEQAGFPDRAGREVHVETQAAVGIFDRGAATTGADPDRPGEILMRIDRGQRPRFARPRGADRASARD